MKTIGGCLYCRIATGAITENVFKIYEDDLIMAFLSNAPASAGHSIIITKEHLCNSSSLSEPLAGKLFHVASRLGVAAKRALNAEGYDIFAAEGYCAGQSIEHFHFHMIPRRLDDGLSFNFKALGIQGDLAETAEKIISNLKIDEHGKEE